MVYKGFSSTRIALKIDVIGRKMYCLEACPYDIQPGNVTGCGREGVNEEGVGKI